MDSRGALLGVVADVYDDPTTQRPAWLAIRTGFFGARVGVAPLRGASLLGDDVVIAHRGSIVSSAPDVDVVVTITPAQQRALSEHYAVSPNRADIAASTSPEGSP